MDRICYTPDFFANDFVCNRFLHALSVFVCLSDKEAYTEIFFGSFLSLEEKQEYNSWRIRLKLSTADIVFSASIFPLFCFLLLLYVVCTTRILESYLKEVFGSLCCIFTRKCSKWQSQAKCDLRLQFETNPFFEANKVYLMQLHQPFSKQETDLASLAKLRVYQCLWKVAE